MPTAPSARVKCGEVCSSCPRDAAFAELSTSLPGDCSVRFANVHVFPVFSSPAARLWITLSTVTVQTTIFYPDDFQTLISSFRRKPPAALWAPPENVPRAPDCTTTPLIQPPLHTHTETCSLTHTRTRSRLLPTPANATTAVQVPTAPGTLPDLPPPSARQSPHSRSPWVGPPKQLCTFQRWLVCFFFACGCRQARIISCCDSPEHLCSPNPI